jgi:hypothetical protein
LPAAVLLLMLLLLPGRRATDLPRLLLLLLVVLVSCSANLTRSPVRVWGVVWTGVWGLRARGG